MEWTPQQFTELSGLSIHTLRYYESLGLLDRIKRNASGHRRYCQHDLDRVLFLKRLLQTGMPIQVMQHYVALFRQGEATLPERLTMLQTHYDLLQAQQREISTTLDFLEGKIKRYQQEIEQHTSQGDER